MNAIYGSEPTDSKRVGVGNGGGLLWRLLLISGAAVVLAPVVQGQTWLSSDVGIVSPMGNSSESGGVVTVRGSGADIWDAADHFHFRHQSLSGDGEIVARITAQENTDAWAKAGVMLRNSLQSNAPYAGVFLTPHGELVVQQRFANGGNTTSQTLAWIGAPVWVRLVRRSSVITAYYSADGSNWQGGAAVSSGVADNAQAGLAVTSHRNGVLSAAAFENVRVIAASVAPPPAAPSNLVASTVGSTSVRLAWTDNASDETAYQLERGTDGTNFGTVAMLSENATSGTDTTIASGTRYYYRVRAARASALSPPSNVVQVMTLSSGGDDMAWHNRDIGAVAVAGSAAESNAGVLTVRGAGDDIWGTADEFHFHYKTVTGDAEVSAIVTAIDNTDASAKAGVMIRAGLEPGAACAFLAFNPSFAATFYQRAAAGAAMGTTGGTAWLGPRMPLRVVRRGDVFTAYANNQVVGSVTLVMPATVAAGFAVTSHRDGTLCSATFESARVLLGQAPSPLPAPAALTAAATSPRTIELAWQYTGTATTSIEVHFSHDGVNFTTNWSTGGTRAVYSGATPDLQYYIKLRARDGSAFSAFSNIVSVRTPSEGGGTPTAPSEMAIATVSSTSLRLSWRDNSSNEMEFRIMRRRDGFNETWFSAAANATSHTDTGLEPGTTYVYEIFAIGTSGGNGSAVGSGTTAQAMTPPPPLQSEDIGGPAVPGQTNVNELGSDTVALSGAGDDIWDARDEFRSYARDLTGDGEVLVRVDAVQNTHYWAKAGVMLRASSDPAAANVFLYATADFRVGLQVRSANGGTTSLVKQLQGVSPTWLRLRRTGSEVEVMMSTDQRNWGLVDRVTITLPATARAGLAVTSHADGTLCRAQFGNLRVYGGTSTSTGTPPPPPPPPTPTPSTWTRTAIGPQGIEGSSTELASGSVTVRGAGTDIWDTADGFVFYNRPLRGDGSITARVQSLADTHAWAKAGVMIRAALNRDSPHVLAYITPSNGAGSHTRAATVRRPPSRRERGGWMRRITCASCGPETPSRPTARRTARRGR